LRSVESYGGVGVKETTGAHNKSNHLSPLRNQSNVDMRRGVQKGVLPLGVEST
jgi:hypothetical protein